MAVTSIPLVGGSTLSLVQGDIVEERVDVIVNAANEGLQHGGGVAGAIARAGGSTIQRESDAIGHVETGAAAFTGAGGLPSRFVVHAVGPVWRGGGEHEAELLASAVTAALRLADELHAGSIALPAISTGIYGYPRAEGARVIVAAIADYFAARKRDERPSGIRDVRITLVDREGVEAFERAIAGSAPCRERQEGA